MKKNLRNKREIEKMGFALISTILIMSLLAVLALGVMNISSSMTRSLNVTKAQQEAEANAQLALYAAVGKLQELAGPDKVATGTGWIIDESAKHRHLAGFWDSYRPDPLSPPADYDTEKANRFKGWLASNLDETLLTERSFAQNGEFTDPVLMLGKGTLGDDGDPKNYAYAGKIPIKGAADKVKGHMAYVGFDEGVKGRANLAMGKEGNTLIERTASLGSASRAAYEKLLPDTFDPATAETEKFISLPEMELGTELDLGKYAHDISLWSRGVMSNVADGGLRDDLNLAADGAAPVDLAGKRVYEVDALRNNPSAPYWQQILDYASIYKKVEDVGGLPHVSASVVDGYIPSTGTGANIKVNKSSPEGMVLMPVVAKVQVVFSLVARNAHGGWYGQLRPINPNFRYMLHMVYSPVVTLYNPYNVAVKFDKMNLNFENLPIGFNYYRNGQPQTNQVMPLHQLYVWQDRNVNATKSFSMSIQGSSGSSSGAPGGSVTLQPGESRVFSPYMPPNFSWAQDRNGDGQLYFDWRNDKTRNIKGVPGWEGGGNGFDIDWLTPRNNLTAADEDKMGVLALKWADTVRVEFASVAPLAAKNRMTITSSLTTGNKTTPASVVEIDYDSEANLKELVNNPTGEKFIFPADGEANITCGQIHEANGTPIKNYIKGKPFAVFSIYAKTPKGGGTAKTDADGRYLNKAWSFTNPLSAVSSAKVEDKGTASLHAYELNLEALPGNADEHVQVDADDRGNFITGHSTLNGLKFGTHSEIPVGPIQSVANLQNANLCASGYLPKFDYPVANSLSHPLLTINKVQDGDMLDHSYLLNHYLYDRFYCSSISDLTTAAFATSGKRSTLKVFEDFASGEKGLQDSRLIFWSPAGGVDDIKDKIAKTPNQAYSMVAATQMIEGPWNVNSLSVEGWKMVLAGFHKTDFPVYDALSNSLITKVESTNPMSRFTLPNGGVDVVAEGDPNPVGVKKERWAGYRELQDDELDKLAEEIVKEVRNRGPFLSLTEFVNRRLSGSSDMMLRGALEAAIDNAQINDMYKADGREITKADLKDYKFKNVDAAIGDSTQGAPGRISQGHIMNVLGNAVTVRSDTFTIRAYGDSVDSSGKIIAKAWCEAVIQRVPDYVDTTDMAFVKPADLTSDANKKFGRKLQIVSFRWLSPAETLEPVK